MSQKGQTVQQTALQREGPNEEDVRIQLLKSSHFAGADIDICFVLLLLLLLLRRLKIHEEKQTKQKSEESLQEGAVPAYLLDREKQNRAKVLSNMIKQKRKEKAVSKSQTNLC